MVVIEPTALEHLPSVSLESRRDALYARLDSGYDKIERAIEAGEDVTRWELGWHRLLREYEYVCELIESRSSYHSAA